jgi:hypothetical protein
MGTKNHFQNASCLACGAKPTIRAHLIPQAFAREVREGDKNLALMIPKFRLSQNGLFDDSILCQECDNRLGENEKYAFETFRYLRAATVSKLNTHIGVSPLSGDRLIRFAAGIGWKYCVTRPGYGRMNIGPYADVLKQAALGAGEIPPAIDMFMVRLKAIQFEERFFRAPKPDRQFGINFIRLTLGAFLMLLKIDKRPNPAISLPEIWMRGRNEVVFPVLPMTMFEEGRWAVEGWKHDRKLAKFVLQPIIKEIERIEQRQISFDEVRWR